MSIYVPVNLLEKLHNPAPRIPSVEDQRSVVEQILEETTKRLIGRRITWTTVDYRLCTEETSTGTIESLYHCGAYVQKRRAKKSYLVDYRDLSHTEDKELALVLNQCREAYRKQGILDDLTEYIIYALVDPRSMLVFYIGISMDIQTRYKQHITCSGCQNELKNTQIRKIQAERLQPILAILERVRGIAYARECESDWIYTYLSNGISLTNIDHVKPRGDR